MPDEHTQNKQQNKSCHNTPNGYKVFQPRQTIETERETSCHCPYHKAAQRAERGRCWMTDGVRQSVASHLDHSLDGLTINADKVQRQCAKDELLPAEIGIGLTGLGFLFLFLGVLFFFDKGLIALGNVSLISWP